MTFENGFTVTIGDRVQIYPDSGWIWGRVVGLDHRRDYIKVQPEGREPVWLCGGHLRRLDTNGDPIFLEYQLALHLLQEDWYGYPINTPTWDEPRNYYISVRRALEKAREYLSHPNFLAYMDAVRILDSTGQTIIEVWR